MTRLPAWWLRSVVATVLIASVGLPAAAEQWPGWRKDGSGISQETGVPHEWGPTNNLRWKTRILGDGGSSPVVWDDQVFLTATAAGKQKHSLHTAALVLVTLLSALALWGYLDGTFGDPLGQAGRAAGESKAGCLARKVLLVGAVGAVGYGTILVCEKTRDAVPLKYRTPLLGRNVWLNAPNAAQMSPNSPEEGVGVDTPSSAFRALRNDSPNSGGRGLYWSADRIPRACYYAGFLGGLTILAVNHLLTPRRRLAGAAPPPGGVTRSARRVFLAAAHLAGLLLAVCFILTVHSGAMADLGYNPDGVTWFSSATIGCLGLLAVAAALPRDWPWRLAAGVLALVVVLFLSFAGPATWRSFPARAAFFPQLAGLTAVAFVASLAASSWRRREEAGGARTGWPALRPALRPALLLALFVTYFASANYLPPNSAWMSEVVCLDRESGRIRWGTTCHVGKLESKLHYMNTPATPTPVTDGEHVFAHFGEAGVYCLSLDGRVLWEYTDPVKPPHWGAGSSPILCDDLVVMTYDGDRESITVALDKKTGRERWRADRTGRSEVRVLADGYSTPIARTRGGKPELIHYAAKLLAGYDPQTGEERWSFPVPGEQPVATPVVWDDLIVLLGGDYTPYTGAVRVVEKSGRPVAEEAWGSTRNVAKVCSPVVWGDYVYAVETANGIATCLRADTGDVVWKKRLGGSHFLASPTAADGKIFFCDSLGHTTVIAASPEFRRLSRNALGEPVTASFAISGGNIFIRGQDHLYCIGGASPAHQSP